MTRGFRDGGGMTGDQRHRGTAATATTEDR
jgi:hypothetical protein